jgi:Repeat of unknown function (DUF5650)
MRVERKSHIGRVARTGVAVALLVGMTSVASTTSATAVGLSSDLLGPVGSEEFGTIVQVLANGNFVVVDPRFDSPTAADVGAVYLYDGTTNTVISTATGSSVSDQIGAYGILEVGGSNFVIQSPSWDNGAAADAGAATWVNGVTGLNGPITAANSLVGSTTNDQVGRYGTKLTNRNYVMVTASWKSGAASSAGAVTWANGESGIVGAVSSANSLVGSTSGDSIGSTGVTTLSNGNFVVVSPQWNNGAATSAGAVTWANGTSPTSGPVTAANSLVGTQALDSVGSSQVAALSNGNYVVTSSQWNKGVIARAGAATWGSGVTGVQGPVTTANSLTGVVADDAVGLGGATALKNGSYVVLSPDLHVGVLSNVGATTWADGMGPTAAVVGAANSLVGVSTGDRVGSGGLAALTNGNYVVRSYQWRNGAVLGAGAVTWRPGTSASPAVVGPTNSLVGTVTNDSIGYDGIIALTNGNYVVLSPFWDNAGIVDAGAATWGNGSAGATGPANATNSLVGTTADDLVGSNAVALTNGNYVVVSSDWDKLGVANAGAVTWANGAAGLSGSVTTANSLTGTTLADGIGQSGVTALSTGNYVVASRLWDAPGAADAGAITFANGAAGINGTVSASNSLVGTTTSDRVGSYGVTPSEFGNYAVVSPSWDNGATVDAGAVTYGPPTGIVGPVSTANSAVGTPPGPLYSVSQRATTANNLLVSTNQERILVLPIGAPPDVVPVAPARLVDTRPGAPTIDGAFAGGGLRSAGSVLELTVAGRGGVPIGANAAALNVTAVSPTASGYVTVFPCGSTMPTASNLNFADANVPNAVATKIGTGGKVCVFVSAATQLIVDVNGYFPTTGRLTSMNPARLIDTRPGAATFDGLQLGDGIRAARSTTTVQVTGRASVPANAAAVVLNVTVASATGTGFITVYPCGTPLPNASNINYVAGSTIAGFVIAKLGAGGTVCLYADGATHLIADVSGYLPAISSYTPLNPARLLDTRPGASTIDGQSAGAGVRPAGTTTEVTVIDRVGVPATSEMVMLNVTVTGPTAGGFITVYPCGTPQPTASNLNFTTGATIANAVVAKVGAGGKVCLFNSDPTQLIVDINGFFKPTGSPWFVPDNYFFAD